VSDGLKQLGWLDTITEWKRNRDDLISSSRHLFSVVSCCYRIPIPAHPLKFLPVMRQG